MKIIQSYAHFDEGSPYLNNNDTERKYLQFYSFLLSYATLKKYYDAVTMYCNYMAYDNLIKYIPYDNVVIAENKNSFKYWSYYKIDIIKQMAEDFIHVDSDVFIFDDLYSKFINNKQYDIIVQDVLAPELNISRDYVKDFADFLIKNKIYNPNEYDGKCFSCGTIGMRAKYIKDYVKMCDSIKGGFDDYSKVEYKYLGMVCEELALYLFTKKHNLTFYDVLPFDKILQFGTHNTGNIMKYTHMWFHTKFEILYANLIRKKLLNYYQEYQPYIIKYEKKIMQNTYLYKEILDKFNH